MYLDYKKEVQQPGVYIQSQKIGPIKITLLYHFGLQYHLMI